MSIRRRFRVLYGGPDRGDRAALDRPGFKLYPSGRGPGGSGGWLEGGEPPVEFRAQQGVRLEARDSEEARRLVIDALGRAPEGLKVVPGSM